MRRLTSAPFRRLAFCLILAAFRVTSAMAATLEIFHADSLAGPMRKVGAAFELQHPGVTVRLTPGVSRDLAARILNGEPCDVFASSSPAVIEQDLMNRKLRGTDQDAATWFVVFSANEMVVITAKGNPLGVREIADLAGPKVKFVRVTGEKDLATGRTIEFVTRAAKREGKPELAPKILEGAPVDPAKPTGVPEVVAAVKDGRANAGIVYYSTAVAARNDVDVIRFPDDVNMSEAIRNAAVVPATARNTKEAEEFVAFLLSADGRRILADTGQPPVVPAIRNGPVPAGIR